VEARSTGNGLSVGLNKGGVAAGFDKMSKTPAGKAIRACIIEISDYLVCSMTKGKNDPCMESYAKKESSRREKTKDAIKLE
jgi:hypothetical protein